MITIFMYTYVVVLLSLFTYAMVHAVREFKEGAKLNESIEYSPFEEYGFKVLTPQIVEAVQKNAIKASIKAKKPISFHFNNKSKHFVIRYQPTTDTFEINSIQNEKETQAPLNQDTLKAALKAMIVSKIQTAQ